jgi:aminocarboxymuconate-semialdehyde decarboxylase
VSSVLCHTCGHHHGTAVDAGFTGARLPHPTLDMHCHLAVEAVERRVQDDPRRREDAARYAQSLGKPSTDVNLRMRDTIAQRLVSPAERIADMDRLGIDVQVLSPSPMQYHYWADEALARELSGLLNTHIAEVVSRTPERFVGLGYAPLQHPQLAAEILRELMRSGLHGIEISSDPTGQGLDDPALEVVWETAAALGATIFLHPMGTSLGPRVNRYYLANIIGQPLESTIAVAQMIHSGVFDRHPKLKLCVAHGGGFLPFTLGRFDHGHGVRPEAQGCKEPPSTYLSRIWFDTVVFRPDAVRTLVDFAGVRQVVAGTDYPFDMGEYALHALIAQVPGLADADRAAILGGNAAHLLGLAPQHPALVAARTRIEALR